MTDFKITNDLERDYFNRDFSKISVLMQNIRHALITGEELSEEDYSDVVNFVPNNTLIYISLFQSGNDMIRYGSRRNTFIRTINRDIEMLRKNKNFDKFDISNFDKCRIMLEYTYDRHLVNPEEINGNKFDDKRFESGITGIEIRHDDTSYYYMPSDAITYSHLGLKSALIFLARKTPVAKMTNSISERLKIIIDNYEHYLFKSRAFVTYKDSVLPLYRANIRYTDYDNDLARNIVLKSADWLIKYMQDDGRFMYYYDCCGDNNIDHEHPGRKEDNLYYNDLRHSGGIITLLRAYQLSLDTKYIRYAQRALNWSLTTLCEDKSGCYAFYNNKAKLGGTGVLTVAAMQFKLIAKTDSYDEYIKGMVRHLISRISESGEMLGYYIHPEYNNGKPLINLSDEERKSTFSFYYPGEALLGLGLYANNFDDELSDTVKQKSRRALDWIVNERPKIYGDLFTSLPSDAWLMQAIEEWAKNPDFIKQEYIDFVYNDADTMVDKMYKRDDSPYIDYEGGYYYEYGDHYYPDGARSEGLVAAYYLSKMLGSSDKAKFYLEACKKAAMCQFHLFNSEENVFPHKNWEKSLHSVRFKATRQWVRVDSVQHVACFLSRLYMAELKG